MTEPKPETLLDAIRIVMDAPGLAEKYPLGINGVEMRDELAKREWLPPLCSVLDIIDEMRGFYGKPR